MRPYGVHQVKFGVSLNHHSSLSSSRISKKLLAKFDVY
jgi:hypothetical protein